MAKADSHIRKLVSLMNKCNDLSELVKGFSTDNSVLKEAAIIADYIDKSKMCSVGNLLA